MKEEVSKLASLARIKIAEKDLDPFAKEFDSILAYVGQLEGFARPDARTEKPTLRNVTRSDGEPHAVGIYTEKIAAQFPAREGDSLSVKQIIQHD